MNRTSQPSRGEKFGRLSKGWAIGSAEFKGALKEELKQRGAADERFGLLGADRAAHREARAEMWEEKLQRAAAAGGIALAALPARKSAPEKVCLAAVMKTGTSVSNGWLAERLEMGPAASVSQYVRRFRLEKEHATPGFKRMLSRINT